MAIFPTAAPGTLAPPTYGPIPPSPPPPGGFTPDPTQHNAFTYYAPEFGRPMFSYGTPTEGAIYLFPGQSPNTKPIRFTDGYFLENFDVAGNREFAALNNSINTSLRLMDQMNAQQLGLSSIDTTQSLFFDPRQLTPPYPPPGFPQFAGPPAPGTA